MYGSTIVNAKDPLLPPQSAERRKEFAVRRQSRRDALKKQMLNTKANHSVLGTLMGQVDKDNNNDRQQSRGSATSGIDNTGSSPLPVQNSSTRKPYSLAYTVLNPNSKQLPAVIFKYFITTVIICDLFAFILQTDLRLAYKYDRWFVSTEEVVSWIFLVEYIARWTTCVENAKYSDHPVWGRLRFMKTRSAIVDLVATLPFFIEQLIPGADLPTLTFIRVFRLARILKTAGLVRAMDAVYRVIYYNRDVLVVAVWVCLVLILVTAIMLYMLRPLESRRIRYDPSNPDADLNEFHSIPATLYLTTLMLTGQGGPTDDDLPWYTRIVVLVTAVFSVAMFAIPASMLTWGFEAGALLFECFGLYMYLS